MLDRVGQRLPQAPCPTQYVVSSVDLAEPHSSASTARPARCSRTRTAAGAALPGPCARSIASGSPAPPSRRAPRSPRPARPALTEVAARVADAAGRLRRRSRPPCRLITQAALRAELDRKLRRDLPVPPSCSSRRWSALRLHRRRARRRSTSRLLDFYASQVLGFYEPEGDEMVVVDTPAAARARGRSGVGPRARARGPGAPLPPAQPPARACAATATSSAPRRPSPRARRCW